MYIATTSQIVTVDSIGTLLPAIALVGREYITVQNVGSVTVYVGGTMVTADTSATGGFQLLSYGTWGEDNSDKNLVYGRTESNNCQVLVQEGK